MMDLSRAEYYDCSTIYSWDAASGHISKELFAEVQRRNAEAPLRHYPIVKTASSPPEPNLIESVFSGMSRAIIHNSDYPSIEAHPASDRYVL